METKKFCLTEKQMPTQWYNIVADMPNKPLPPLHPGTKKPVTKEQMSAIFAEELIDQEMSTERYIDIPEEVQEIYRIWRPTPLVRATGLEKALGTPAKIFFKNESVSPAGSHKPNTAVPQAYYNYKQGIKHLTTETGAGQWGASIAFAAKHFGIDLQVFMVKVSYDQKPYRRLMMNTWGAECVASPSTLTESGRAALERDPHCSGSLGLAISEAVEMALRRPEDTRYCLGSVLNHVVLHQTVIGQEAVTQMEMADAEPDMVIGCFGGGSNFAGIGFPFLRKNFAEGKKIRVIAVEPEGCPKLTRGEFQYDFGDVGRPGEKQPRKSRKPRKDRKLPKNRKLRKDWELQHPQTEAGRRDANRRRRLPKLRGNPGLKRTGTGRSQPVVRSKASAAERSAATGQRRP